MNSSQILPGAVNPDACALATGYYLDVPFIVYSSGKNVVILDSKLRHIQTILGSDCGYVDSNVGCIHCAESTGKIAVAWGTEVVIFEPERVLEESSGSTEQRFPGLWQPFHTLNLDHEILCCCWDKEGVKLLTGGDCITLWQYFVPQLEEDAVMTAIREHVRPSWKETWKRKVAVPVMHLKFSADGFLFSSSGENDRLVKIWSPSQIGGNPSSGTVLAFSSSSSTSYMFTYIAHPRAVTGLSWRKTSSFMPRHAVPNILLTHCEDNICRLWSHRRIRDKKKTKFCLRFFIAASIDPNSDIPFRTTMAIDRSPFTVHWLNNKETAFRTKVQRDPRLYHSPDLSRRGSIGSLASAASSDEVLQSWVCVVDNPQGETSGMFMEQQTPSGYPTHLTVPGAGGGHQPHVIRSATSSLTTGVAKVPPNVLRQLMDSWLKSPDLIISIHPQSGALMVWTVEGLDGALYSTRLVHISFSSCLPHTFPPHLAQSLCQELLQFVVHDLDPSVGHLDSSSLSSSMSSSLDIHVPVPEVRIPHSTSISAFTKEEVNKTRAESSLVLVSKHLNGSINTWSVELTRQSIHGTSIAGLIHCGETGGHRYEVKAIHRHPWLPVLMTVSFGSSDKKKRVSNGVNSELIIWNADLPGPLEHESRIVEISRMTSTDSLSFCHVTWVPPISTQHNCGALSRCPSTGVFVASVGNELRLYQTSLYTMGKLSPEGSIKVPSGALDSNDKQVLITSHVGSEGISMVGVIEKDFLAFDTVVSLHSFRVCSFLTTADIQESYRLSRFSGDIVVTLVENRTSHMSELGSGTTKSFLHVWWALLGDSIKEETEMRIEKVHFGALPLPSGVHVVRSNPASDIASSLQLQLPTLSAPFLFSTACSDGSVCSWQFSAMSRSTGEFNPLQTLESRVEEVKSLDFQLLEVFGAHSSDTSSASQATKPLNCYKNSVLSSFPIVSYIPSAVTNAYAGRCAMSHYLSRAASPSDAALVYSLDPMAKHALVSIWESESSGGLEWSCEATLPLTGVGALTVKKQTANPSVLLDWIPMENGAYLLSTCFASVISIFGQALPSSEELYSTSLRNQSPIASFLPVDKVATLDMKSFKSSWVCLIRFPCAKPYPDLSVTCLAYTGSNSLLFSVGSEMHVYSCWVKEEKLKDISLCAEMDKFKNLAAYSPSIIRRERPEANGGSYINLLEYAHSMNTPLPQYHPKILIELMNSGKLGAVKAILLNVFKYLLLYKVGSKPTKFEGFTAPEEEDEQRAISGKRPRLLTMVADGHLKRSRFAQVNVEVEHIPPLSLSKLGVFEVRKEEESRFGAGDEDGYATEHEDDYDDLFSTNTLSPLGTSTSFGFDDEETEGATNYSDIDPEKSIFSPEMAQELSSILQYCKLQELSDLDQVRLLAISETVANTKTGFSADSRDVSVAAAGGSIDADTSVGMVSMSSGAGYASTILGQGRVGGGEAMDECGLRFLLILQNYITLSESLPSDVRPSSLCPSDFVWGFHSDAKTELLSAIPCVQRDRLSWSELRNVGAGWWIRSADTLRRLIEKLAKTQFLEKQDPLDASLFYLAMKKKSLLKGLYKSISDKRMMDFFTNDFTKSRWHKAAMKNAFALLGKQRFEHAAAFFLLAGELWDAVEVCVNRLGDFQLAWVVIRLYEGDQLQGGGCELFLRKFILGEQMALSSSSSQPSSSTTKKRLLRPRRNPDPFLRSIAHWLLQDYSNALETLLLLPETVVNDVENQQHLDPKIFSFYFFLRMHPLLMRRDVGAATARRGLARVPAVAAHTAHISGVGTEPLTPAERSLLFSTAYHHLINGCPLLALDALSKLPKSANLGSDVGPSRTTSTVLDSGGPPKGGIVDTQSVEKSMIQSGTLGLFTFGHSTSISASSHSSISGGGGGDEEIDWSTPLSLQGKDNLSGGAGVGEEADDFDWSKPVSSQITQDQDEEDWSKPVSFQPSTPPNGRSTPSDDSTATEEEDVGDGGSKSSNILSTRGLFILSLAEQLQYNASLSILTEELRTIHLPACCEHLWNTKGAKALPLLPLKKHFSKSSLVEYQKDSPFEKTVLSLRGLLVEWLRKEMKMVKHICRFEMSSEGESGEQQGAVDPNSVSNSGYDLLTTLMNYVFLHAATSPSMLTIKFEMMHLMNSLLPWDMGTLSLQEGTDAPAYSDPSQHHFSNYAVDPAQLPILMSCSLPAKHLSNPALHLRLMSASIMEMLSAHGEPPTASKPLPHAQEVFQLCCAISNCLTDCLTPFHLSDFAVTQQQRESQKEETIEARAPLLSISGSEYYGLTPPLQRSRARTSSTVVDYDVSSLPDKPNTKPSSWPGVANWPSHLQSEDGKEPTPLSLVLVESCVMVYVGLLSVAWSWHAVQDLLILLANCPASELWYTSFGGGLEVKTKEKSSRRKRVLQKMTKRFRMMRQQQSSSGGSTHETEGPLGVFVAPSRTLLNHFLLKPNASSKYPDIDFDMDTSDDSSDGGEEDEEEGEGEGEGGKRRGGGGSGWKIGGSDEGPGGWGEMEEEDGEGRREDHNNPDCFSWCLMNLCITKVVQGAVRSIINTAGMEIIEPLGSLGESSSPLIDQRMLYRETDGIITSLCINTGGDGNLVSLATSREVLEIELPDLSSLEAQLPDNSSTEPPAASPGSSVFSQKKSLRSFSIGGEGDEYVMIPQQSLPTSSMARASLTPSRSSYHSVLGLQHAQTGTASSILLRRNVMGVKRMASHPNLCYYLTGSLDGSVMMWEFGTPSPVSTQRPPTGGVVTKIRFTPQGNKYGVTDATGKLYLWQGIHTSSKTPYQTLNSGMRILNDFVFLESSSFIAVCGETPDNRSLCLWDALLPPKRSIVREYMCHEGGSSALGYSPSLQRLFCGGKRGDICVFDIRQNALLQSITVHTGAVNCIVVNDVDGYFVTGSSDGDIKVLDISSNSELAYFPGVHSKARLFRSEGGVRDMQVMPGGHLYSCGGDGAIRFRSLSGVH